MKVTHTIEKTKLPAKMVFTVEDPLTHDNVYQIEIDRSEAQNAIAYLREHNGNAPEFVHALIDGMELALTLRVKK